MKSTSTPKHSLLPLYLCSNGVVTVGQTTSSKMGKYHIPHYPNLPTVNILVALAPIVARAAKQTLPV